jgi:hypothetical protein
MILAPRDEQQRCPVVVVVVDPGVLMTGEEIGQR